MKTKIINNDSIKELKNIKDDSIDFILTDPPYELDLHGGGKTNDFKHRKIVDQKHIEYISNGFDSELFFNEFIRILKKTNLVLFCSNKQISKTMMFFEKKGYSTTLLVWSKSNPIPFSNNKYVSDLEFIVYVRETGATFNNIGFKNQLKTFTYPSPSESNRIHPTEKPIPLLKRLLSIHTNKNDTVLDCFAGSFSTGLACLELDRDFVGIEKDPEMFEKAKKRFNEKKKLKNQIEIF